MAKCTDCVHSVAFVSFNKVWDGTGELDSLQNGPGVVVHLQDETNKKPQAKIKVMQENLEFRFFFSLLIMQEFESFLM